MPAPLLDAAALADVAAAAAGALGGDPFALLAECSEANVRAYLSDEPGETDLVRPVGTDEIRRAQERTLRAPDAREALRLLRAALRDDAGRDFATAEIAFGLARFAAAIAPDGEPLPGA